MKEELLVQLAKSLLYEKALVKLDGKFVGAIASIPKNKNSQDLNYNEVFIRDNVPVMIYLLLEGKYEIVRHFLNTCLRLQSSQFQTRGIFPTSFAEIEGKLVADYGQRAIGRVCSVDASLWWVILAYIYVKKSGDRTWAATFEVQSGIQHLLNLILHPSFRDSPTLFVPDGAFMIDRALDVWGNPVEIQVLLYGALLSAVGLIQVDLEEKGYTDCQSSASALIDRQLYQKSYAIAWLKNLRSYMLKHYWVNSKIVQTLRRRPTEQYGDSVTNEYNIQTETIPHWLQEWLGDQGGYLIGNVRTGRPDFRFFTLGNCLGATFDLISPAQQRSLFHLMCQNQTALFAQMPLRICHPPLDNEDWRKKTGYDRKNLPWCYHNAGHWPCLFWFFVIATLRHKCHQSSVDHLGIDILLQDNYELLARRLPQQNWAEYFDGPNGVWVGQQARLYQTWTIVGFLLTHHFLKVNPEDTNIMDLPSLKDIENA
ncbi:glycogen debranching enzyme [Synechococcus sp. PCC 7502]|uniref:glycoside hydrolase 100 family protein n=1 Tax=Synechococcus sp. PCC 7502 TaxID=1173263 RepID=UPI00029FE1CE|nr:glycoside hydrolase 100 family protein [Synechococcus sp. PCC 7502]AFY72653.1 glycogen debranching enzyme [Synechococcus sp. PCC 7502]